MINDNFLRKEMLRIVRKARESGVMDDAAAIASEFASVDVVILDDGNVKEEEDGTLWDNETAEAFVDYFWDLWDAINPNDD